MKARLARTAVNRTHEELEKAAYALQDKPGGISVADVLIFANAAYWQGMRDGRAGLSDHFNEEDGVDKYEK